MNKNRLWLDDNRIAPDGWEWVEDYAQAIEALQSQTWEHVSLDHDLGWYYWSPSFGDAGYDDFGFNGWQSNYGYDPKTDLTGFDVVKWMVENEVWPTDTLATHTDNAQGRARMVKLIDDHSPFFHRHWYESTSTHPFTTGWLYYATDVEEE